MGVIGEARKKAQCPRCNAEPGHVCINIIKTPLLTSVHSERIEVYEKIKISEGACCPQCKKNILWDWCNDTYVYEDGEPLIQAPGHEGGIFTYSCLCGMWIGMSIDNDQGMIMYECPALIGISWEDEENSYGG